MIKRFAYALVALTVLALPSSGQEEEDTGGLLVRLLEGALSSENSNVKVRGLEGALSSRATIQGIEVSDPDGIWLEIEDAVLDWNRLALVRGRFSVNALTAGRVAVHRPPLPSEDTEAPTPEAQPFSMPELPVAVDIRDLAVTRLELGADVIGVDADLSAKGRVKLADGELDTQITVNRLDRSGDTIALTAGFSNETRVLAVDLRVDEAQDGIIAHLLNLPGTPPVVLTAQGNGPLTDFAADLSLATDQTERLRGRVELTGDAEAIAFTGGLSGDLRPLMEPDFHAFFGPETQLRIVGRAEADGRLDVSDLSLSAEALTLIGNLALSPETRPARVNLDLTLGRTDGAATILPVSGAATRLRQLQLRTRFDADQSPGWSLTARAEGFTQPSLSLGGAEFAAQGQYQPGTDAPLTGDLRSSLSGLDFADPGLAQGIGQAMTLTGAITLHGAGRLTLSDFLLSGEDYAATLNTDIAGLQSGFAVDGQAQLDLRDLSRFTTLAGRPVAGALTATLDGEGDPLGGVFDFVLTGTGTDLRAGQETLDTLLIGQTALTLAAARGPEGLIIRNLDLNGEALTLMAEGTARTGQVALDVQGELDDLARILPDLPGPVTMSGQTRLAGGTWHGDLGITAPGQAQGRLTATVPQGAGPGLAFDLDISEPAGGPIGQILRLPGAPALRLTADASGAIDDLETVLALSTQGIPRITGRATIRDAQDDTRLTARVEGDVTPFLTPDYHAFFGTESDIAIQATRQADGTLDLTQLTVNAASLDLTGTASIDPAGRPLRAEMTADIAPRPGTAGPVRLPLPGAPITVKGAQLRALLDGQGSEIWTLLAKAQDVSHPQGGLGELTINGDGTLDVEEHLSASGRLRAHAQGLRASDPALQAALGSWLRLDGQFDLPGDDTLVLRDLFVNGQDMQAQARATLSELNGAQDITGEARLDLPDLARFSGLARRPLGGQVSATLTGSGGLSPRRFDIVLNSTAQDMSAGIARLDPLLEGTYKLHLDANSQGDGVDITALRLTGPAITASASGFASPTVPDLTAQLHLDDFARIVSGFQGPVNVAFTADHQNDTIFADLDLAAPNDSYLRTEAALAADGAASVSFDGLLNRLERFVPDFPGSLGLTGQAGFDSGTWSYDATIKGPADIQAEVAGLYDTANGTVDGTAKGNLRLDPVSLFLSPIVVAGQGLFDLKMQGTPGLSALSGQVDIRQTSVAVPQIQNSVQDFGGSITLGDGSAALNLTGALRTGGTFSVAGPVALAAPYNGNLSIALRELIMTDEVVYRAPVSGQLSVSGPLAGNALLAGRVDIGETEIDIGNIGGSSAAAPIPDLTHVGETAAIRTTRANAGLIQTGSQSSAPAIGLDLLISAPRKIFVRGRGLDAELGGELYLRGTTANVAPSGQIELIRGILALFGRRLQLSRGLLTMQGSFQPYLEFAATSSTNSGTATLEIAGQVDDLNVTISSEPERPEEEALAMLIFGNEFSSLSPFKIAQLAAGLVSLRGGGDFVGETGREATGASSVSVANDGGGLPSLGVGGYLSDNVYSDVSVNTDGNTELKLNLDVTDNLTVTGTVDNTGDSGIGLFFDRDY